jgi:lysyl-tRNA synthetase class 2
MVLFFPQMKPEVSAQAPVLSAQEEYKLSEDDKVVMNILKDNSPIDLNELKGQTGLSNKKWDKAIKGLTKNKLAKVEKTDAGLFVSLV